jgi:hypothetical protein
MSTIESVILPLTGAGDATTKVAVDNTPDGVIQLFKIVVSADGISTLVPADVDGLFVQTIDRAESPQDAYLLGTSISPGGNIDLDAPDVTTGKTGRLMAVDLGASVPIRCDIQLVNGSRVTRASVYAWNGSERWTAPSPIFFELAGGLNKRFGVSITNLSPYKSADARATLYWDEV